jgi:diguanylate cyclase (GGDEF)-like protein
MIDIDNFKLYNDTYGHQKGDDALISVAISLKNSLNRADDYCFRLGGEEFGVIFKANNEKGAFDFAQIIRANIENLQISHEHNENNKVLTVSIGLIPKRAKSIESVDAMFKLADDLLYTAKKSGKNIVAV